MRYALALIIALFAPSSFAASDLFSSFGLGASLSCGKYLNDILENPSASSAYSWWTAGFITGVNLEKGRVVSTDSPSHEVWLKQYCEKNPLDTFMKAAIELNKELDTKRSR
jgi:hypothetical protein